MTSEDACLEVFRDEFDYIFRTLQRLGTAPSQADDLVQEVFIALRRSWSEYDRQRPLRPYLFGIALRIVAARRRNRKEAPFLGDSEDVEPSVDEAAEGPLLRTMVLNALQRLPLARRAVFVMHDLDDVPVAEAARVLGMRPFTAYWRLQKARREFAVAIRRVIKEVDGG